MNFLNPYSYIGMAIVLAVILGAFGYQNHQIHSWHTKYDSSQTTIVQLQDKIASMTVAQNNQTKTSDQNIIKIVQGPKELQTILKEVSSTPEAATCDTPAYSQNIKDAF